MRDNCNGHTEAEAEKKRKKRQMKKNNKNSRKKSRRTDGELRLRKDRTGGNEEG